METEGIVCFCFLMKNNYIFGSWFQNYISEELEFRAEGNMGILKTVANETKVILNQLERDYKPAEAEKQADKPKLDKFNSVSLFFVGSRI